MRRRQVLMMVLMVALVMLWKRTVADEFSQQDLELWEKECQALVKSGRGVFTDPNLGRNDAACAQCHPNGANTHRPAGEYYYTIRCVVTRKLV